MARKTVLILLGAALLLFGLIQLIPYGRIHRNPPVAAEPAWDSPATRDLARRACFDCHSDESVWPWYSSVAPVSWLVAHDVYEARQRLNFSEWGPARPEALSAVVWNIEHGKMPPAIYTPLHPAARLGVDEELQLIEGFRKTLR